jgi:hypothetical protein
VNVSWDSDALVEMGKQSFRTCKHEWRVQTNLDVAKRAKVNARISRIRERRVTVCNFILHHRTFYSGILQKVFQRAKAIPAIVEKYGFESDAAKKVLLLQENMSDEYSGPEDDGETSKAVWKTKMAFKAGQLNASDSALSKLEFLAVLDAPWRSVEVSFIFPSWD